MIKDSYDIVIIGAGPAGSTAARFAAEKGAKVLILERDRESGIPVRCAEGVSEAGISRFMEPNPQWIATKIEKARLISPNKESAIMRNNGTGYVLERRIFDRELCNIACAKGAELLTKANAIGLIFENDKIIGVKYTHLGKEKEVFCHIVIGADGIESRVGRWGGIKTNLKLNDLDTCAQYTLTGVNFESDTCEFYFGKNISPGGYVWVFPKSRTSANVGVGIAGDMARDKSPKEYLEEFVQEYFPEAKLNFIVYGGVPTAATLKEIVKNNLMLVGDAARQVNPITGGGIITGMIAASIAGKVAGEAIQKGKYGEKFLKKYRKEWDKELGNSHKVIHHLKDKFMKLSDERFNKLVNYCNSIPSEEFTALNLFKRAVKDDPKLVVELAKSFVMSKLKKS